MWVNIVVMIESEVFKFGQTLLILFDFSGCIACIQSLIKCVNIGTKDWREVFKFGQALLTFSGYVSCI